MIIFWTLSQLNFPNTESTLVTKIITVGKRFSGRTRFQGTKKPKVQKKKRRKKDIRIRLSWLG